MRNFGHISAVARVRGGMRSLHATGPQQLSVAQIRENLNRLGKHELLLFVNLFSLIQAIEAKSAALTVLGNESIGIVGDYLSRYRPGERLSRSMENLLKSKVFFGNVAEKAGDYYKNPSMAKTKIEASRMLAEKWNVQVDEHAIILRNRKTGEYSFVKGTNKGWLKGKPKSIETVDFTDTDIESDIKNLKDVYSTLELSLDKTILGKAEGLGQVHPGDVTPGQIEQSKMKKYMLLGFAIIAVLAAAALIVVGILGFAIAAFMVGVTATVKLVLIGSGVTALMLAALPISFYLSASDATQALIDISAFEKQTREDQKWNLENLPPEEARAANLNLEKALRGYRADMAKPEGDGWFVTALKAAIPWIVGGLAVYWLIRYATGKATGLPAIIKEIALIPVTVAEGVVDIFKEKEIKKTPGKPNYRIKGGENPGEGYPSQSDAFKHTARHGGSVIRISTGEVIPA